MNVTPRDISWTGTGGLSDIQSYAYIIFNAIFDRLSNTSFFSNFVCKRISNALPVEGGIQIPFLGVFLDSESMTPDGPINMTDIGFINNVRVGVQIIVKDNDPNRMRETLDRAYWFTLNQLLRDASLTNRFRPDTPDKVPIEGFPRIDVRPDVWGLTGARNETPLGERVFWLTYQFRTAWYPTDFPDLERITVTTAFPPGDAEEQGKTQQVKVVYEFTPDSVPTPLPPDP